MDIESRFDLVAEYRDFSRVRELQQHDAIFDNFFTWMREKDYSLKPEGVSSLIKNVAWNARRAPIFSDLLKETFPEHMAPEVLEAVIEMNFINEGIWEKLKIADNDYRKRNGIPMPRRLLLQEVEKIRKKDLLVYRAHKKWEHTIHEDFNEHLRLQPDSPVFHQFFRPRGEE